MATRVYNVQQGRNKYAAFLGVKDLEKRVNAIQSKMVSRETTTVMVEAAYVIYDQAKANLRSVNAPKRVTNDLFVYGKNQILLRKVQEVTALVGLRKKGVKYASQGYVEWFPSNQRGAFSKDNRTRKKRPRLVVPGTPAARGSGLQKIGENLGTMWELGTTKMAPKPWWRPAILTARNTVLNVMAAGLTKILASA